MCFYAIYTIIKQTALCTPMSILYGYLLYELLGIWETDTMTGNNWSQAPTTLIEMGYMSNPTEGRKMQQDSYQKKMVYGIANGINNYLLGRS